MGTLPKEWIVICYVSYASEAAPGAWVVTRETDETSAIVESFDPGRWVAAYTAAMALGMAECLTVIEVEGDGSETLHLVPRRCAACGTVKPATMFVDSRTHRTGGKVICRRCHAEVMGVRS